jgi:hypothetical protein
MKTIEIDASGWKTTLDFALALKAALGSPDGTVRGRRRS